MLTWKWHRRYMCCMKEGDLSDKNDPRLGVPRRVVIVTYAVLYGKYQSD
uniref:Uncharacterized protein n=1 Tax=Anguilla anguilla TaxID=7936 RepID=A0A0E9WAR0_ANGAN